MTGYIDVPIVDLKGEQGEQGEQGLPGFNSLPADTALAAYVAGVDTLTRAALVAWVEGLGVVSPIRFGAAGDGTTDDTAVFSTLRGLWPDTVVDLAGRAYKVTALPAGRYRNGVFVVDGIYYPAETVVVDRSMVTTAAVVSNWPQDQAHHYRGVRYCGFGRGDGHGTVDNSAWLAESVDMGETWTAAEVFASTGTESAWCASMGVLHGRQFAIVRYAGYPTDTNVEAFRLYSRRLFDMWLLNAPFSTLAGSPIVTVTFPSPHGLRNGDHLNFSGVGSVNGVTISGDKTVTRTGDTTVTVTGTGNASVSSTGVGPTGTRVNVLQQAWSEQLFDGVSFGEAVLAASDMTLLPITVQSLVGFGSGTIVATGSGNTRADLLVVEDVFNAAPTVSTVRISGSPFGFSGVEPSLCTDGTYLYGFSRVVGDTPTRFFWVEDLLDPAVDVHVSDLPRSVGLNRSNPAPVRWDPVQDVLVTVHIDRDNDTGRYRTATVDPVYIGVATTAAARALGGEAFRFLPLTSVLKVPSGYTSTAEAFGAINSGVPSLDIDGDDVTVFFSQERVNPTAGSNNWGTQASNIVACRFSLAALLGMIAPAL